jgi:outer membrane protein TolC
MSRSSRAVTGHLQLIHSARLTGAAAILLAVSLLASAAAQAQPQASDSGAHVGGHSERMAGPRLDALAELPADAGLDDLIRYAMQHSPELAVAYHRWRAAAERAPQARSLPDPELGLGVVLDQVDRDSEYMGERYSISQMFPWFGKLGLKGDIAIEEA